MDTTTPRRNKKHSWKDRTLRPFSSGCCFCSLFHRRRRRRRRCRRRRRLPGLVRPPCCGTPTLNP